MRGGGGCGPRVTAKANDDLAVPIFRKVIRCCCVRELICPYFWDSDPQEKGQISRKNGRQGDRYRQSIHLKGDPNDEYSDTHG